MKSVSVAITPCPNDTFSFYHMLSGELAPRDCLLKFVLKDIESLNEDAIAGTHDVTKMSFSAYLRVMDEYQMLGSGAALGYGCGPLVLRKAGGVAPDFAKARVAIPGKLTTACLLFSLYASGAGEHVYMPYDKIMDSVSSGEVDYGVVIHEGRFVFAERGLECTADLGEWWQGETGLPVPLGCIAAKRSMGDAFADEFSTMLKESIIKVRENPEVALPYIQKHAQELEQSVLTRHISTYVNDYSLDLNEEGREAIALMEKKARAAGLI